MEHCAEGSQSVSGGRDPSQEMPGVWGLASRKEEDVKIPGRRGQGPETRA